MIRSVDEGYVVLHVTLNVLIMEMTGRLPLPPPSAATALRVTKATAEPNPNLLVTTMIRHY